MVALGHDHPWDILSPSGRAALASPLHANNDGFTLRQACQYFVIGSVCQSQHNRFDHKGAIGLFKHKSWGWVVLRNSWILNLELLKHLAGFNQRRGRLLL